MQIKTIISANNRNRKVNDKIIKHIHRGERKAFRQIFDHFFNALAAFGYKYVNNIEIAEDLVQESLISFWEKRLDFENIPTVKSFLYTTVRNKALNYIKHEQVKKKHEPSLQYAMESEQYFSAHVIEEEVFNSLHTQINELPKAAKEIMLLALNGLKNSEIAEELNISINTVKTQKKIGYSKIKDKLSPMMRMLIFVVLIS